MAEALMLVEHAEDGRKEAGPRKTYVANSDRVDNSLVTPVVDVLAALAESSAPAAVLLAAPADGKEIAGRLAARIGSGLLVDVVEVKEGGIGVHSIFGGAFTVDAQANGDTPVITVRAGAGRERHQDHRTRARGRR